MFSQPNPFQVRLQRIKQALWLLSGEDTYLIRASTPEMQQRFTRISLVVVGIDILGFVGGTVFFENAFDLPLGVTIFLGFLVAAVTGNLYVLLLYTITPFVFENRKTLVSDRDKYTFVGAFTIRVGFILLLATAMAQPLSVLLLKRYTDSDIELYRQAFRQEARENLLRSFESYPVSAQERQAQLDRQEQKVSSLLASSHFFVKRIKLLARTNGWYWLLMVLVWVLFFYPIYEKYDIRSHKRLFLEKKELENQIVYEAYRVFEQQYERIINDRIATYNSHLKHALAPIIHSLEQVAPEQFRDLYHRLFSMTESNYVQKFEYWADPPFRTVKRRQDRTILPEKQLLNGLYAEESSTDQSH